MHPEHADAVQTTRGPQYRGEFSSQHYLPGDDLIVGDTATVVIGDNRTEFIYEEGVWWKKD